MIEMRSFLLLLNCSFVKAHWKQHLEGKNMSFKENICLVCGNTRKCSVCKGKGEILTKEIAEEVVVCQSCMGSGKCSHCYHEHLSPGWLWL